VTPDRLSKRFREDSVRFWREGFAWTFLGRLKLLFSKLVQVYMCRCIGVYIYFSPVIVFVHGATTCVAKIGDAAVIRDKEEYPIDIVCRSHSNMDTV
jgi:hypothetical protein